MNTDNRKCYPRKRFEKKAAADAACSSLIARGGPLRLPEACPHCNGWHLATAESGR